MGMKTTVKIYKLIIFIVVFFFGAIIVKLSYVALSNKVDDINLKEFANNRNTKVETIYANRGNVYGINGDIYASTINSYKLIAYLDPKRTTNPNKPQHVVDKAGTAKQLNELLGIDYDRALEILNKENVYQVEFGTKGSNILESVKNKIEAMHIPGIDFISGQKRNYAMGAFASYIIGYAKTREDGDIVGELGIESYYNKELSGTDGKMTYQTDAYGYTLPSAEVLKEDAINGNDIYLTIDTDIQIFAENLTRSLKNNYEMEWMIFTVMDAKTGAIVASSTYPNFDPNKLDIKSYMNPLVSYEYEPGSVMKIFSFASAIEEGVYSGKEIYDSGSVKLTDGTTIKDFNKTGWGKISFDTGFAYSSNVAATLLGKRLKVEKLTNYYKNLGFGKKTGIELANEVNGKINMRYESELATASFGQGITVTPIQMLQALTSLTNDGTTIKPYVVDKIVDANGEIIYKGGRQELNKIYSKDTINYMHKLMHNVVYEGLSSSAYYQPHKTTLIGKTGTAQVASPNGGYLKGKYDYIRSFAGIFPEEDPKYIIYVVVKELEADSARPIANAISKVIDDIVASLGIDANSNQKENKIILLDNYISKEVLTTVEDLKNKKLQVYVLGSGKYIINQYPLKNNKVLENSKVFLVSNDNNYQMINLTGWSLNEVTTYANLLGIKLETSGYGYVTNQSIPPDTQITPDMTLSIELNK